MWLCSMLATCIRPVCATIWYQSYRKCTIWANPNTMWLLLQKKRIHRLNWPIWKISTRAMRALTRPPVGYIQWHIWSQTDGFDRTVAIVFVRLPNISRNRVCPVRSVPNIISVCRTIICAIYAMAHHTGKFYAENAQAFSDEDFNRFIGFSLSDIVAVMPAKTITVIRERSGVWLKVADMLLLSNIQRSWRAPVASAENGGHGTR